MNDVRMVRLRLDEISNLDDAVAAPFRGRSVRIWSAEWRAWWRPDGRGYTDKINDAGIYSFEDAWSRSAHCGPEKGIIYELAGGFE